MGKKHWSIMMCSVLLLGVLAACGSNNETATTTEPAAQTETAAEPAATETAEPAETTAEPAEAASDLQDGMYFAQGEMDAESGWQPYVILQVEGGKITDATWSASSINAGLDKKTSSEEGKYGMKAGGASSEWHEQAEKAEQYLIEKQDPTAVETTEDGKTDAISGVSIHIGSYLQLAEEALAGAK